MSLGDQVEDRMVAIMNRFGYTGSEARAYVALLQQSPATGYELAARGGVPRSAIYGVLKRLEQAGIVNVIPGKPSRYTPLPPDRLIAHLESRFSQDLVGFREAVSQVMETQIEASTWTVSGYDAVLTEATQMIGEATQSVICSLWWHEADRLAPALAAAAERGARVTNFSFTSLPPLPGQTLSYNIASPTLAEYWPRRMIIVTDHAYCLVGSTDGSRLDRAVISDEAVLVETVSGNLVLDIMLYGERQAVDVQDVILSLTQRAAPIESLMNGERPE